MTKATAAAIACTGFGVDGSVARSVASPSGDHAIIEEVLRPFAPITLEEMNGVELLDRIDTKYVFGQALLPALLHLLRPDYRVLEVNGQRGTSYRTLYYDTPTYRHFNDHQSDSFLRSKVRYREYMGSGLCFLEVKRKTGSGRTTKIRQRVESIPQVMPAEHLTFVQNACGANEPHTSQIWNSFRRITFVHRLRQERLTIDCGVSFEREGVQAMLGPVCIAELKQPEGVDGSPFTGIMEDLGQRPTGMSKYCVGLLKLVPCMRSTRSRLGHRSHSRERMAAAGGAWVRPEPLSTPQSAEWRNISPVPTVSVIKLSTKSGEMCEEDLVYRNSFKPL